MKKNCWDLKKCGREPGGALTKEFGICPVATEERLHGIHGGKNAGRSCWVITGSLCNEQVQGSFANKAKNCFDCEFYKLVKEEEDSHFKLSPSLLKLIK